MTKKLELTTAIASDLETLLMNGTPLTTICQTKGSPSLSKVYEWIRTDKEFASTILQARKVAAQTYLDKMITELEAADNKSIMIVREKLHHYRWMASKLLTIYQDKQQVDIDQKVEISWTSGNEDKSFENVIKNVSELGS